SLLEALYGQALALHFPSRYEGFGWPVIEAQACACPVICSNREPLPEVAGGAAIECDPEDFASQAAAILKLTRQPELSEELSQRAALRDCPHDRTLRFFVPAAGGYRMRVLLRAFLVMLPWPLKRPLLRLFYGYELHPTSRIGFAWVFPRRLVMQPHTRIGHLTV